MKAQELTLEASGGEVVKIADPITVMRPEFGGEWTEPLRSTDVEAHVVGCDRG